MHLKGMAPGAEELRQIWIPKTVRSRLSKAKGCGAGQMYAEFIS